MVRLGLKWITCPDCKVMATIITGEKVAAHFSNTTVCFAAFNESLSQTNVNKT